MDIEKQIFIDCVVQRAARVLSSIPRTLSLAVSVLVFYLLSNLCLLVFSALGGFPSRCSTNSSFESTQECI